MIFRFEGLLDVLKFPGTDFEQGDDAVGIDAQAVGNELVIGSERSQTEADAV
jgi:hypothetical protein